jgi:hypothetical protein
MPPLQLQSLLCGTLNTPVPEQLPVSTLTKLGCHLDWRRPAEVTTLCSLTALQKLDMRSARGFTSWQADDALAPLSALQRLTSLQLDRARRRQLQHLRVPLLLELAIGFAWQEQEDALQLQMGHLSSLSQLKMSDWAASMQLEDTWPLGLQELDVIGGSSGVYKSSRGFSFQPLLRLQQLRKLRLQFSGMPDASEEAVRQLSRLTSLQEIHLNYGWRDNEAMTHCDMAAAPSAWTGLPLKSVSWSSTDIPVGVLHSIGHLHDLARLELCMYWSIAGLKVTPGQLAATLRPLTELRQLRLHVWSCVFAAHEASNRFGPCSSSGSDTPTVGHSAAVFDDVDDLAALLRCVGVLRKVEELNMVMLLRLSGSDVQLLQGMLQQLLPRYMLPYCKVQADKISIYL